MQWLLTPPLKTIKLWHTFQACLNYIPKAHYLIVLGDFNHYLIVLGDFNTVLRADPPFVGLKDPEDIPICTRTAMSCSSF